MISLFPEGSTRMLLLTASFIVDTNHVHGTQNKLTTGAIVSKYCFSVRVITPAWYRRVVTVWFYNNSSFFPPYPIWRGPVALETCDVRNARSIAGAKWATGERVSRAHAESNASVRQCRWYTSEPSTSAYDKFKHILIRLQLYAQISERKKKQRTCRATELSCT